MAQCNVPKEIENNQNRLREIRKYWNSKPNLTLQFGFAGLDKMASGDTNKHISSADYQLKYGLYQRIRKEWADDIRIKDEHIDVMKRNIDRLDKEFNKAETMNHAYQMTQLPSMVHARLPSSKDWLKKINAATRQERVWQEQFSGNMENIGTLLKAALVESEAGSKITKKFPTLEMIRKLEKKIESTEDTSLKEQYYLEMVKNLEKTEGGRVIYDYHNLVQMTLKDAKAHISERNNAKLVDKDGEIMPPVNEHIMNAYNETRRLLGGSNEVLKEKDGKMIWVAPKGKDGRRKAKYTGLANVLIRSLESSKRTADEVYTANDHTMQDVKDPTNKAHLDNFKDKIDIQINAIKDAAREGGYFPHKIFDTIAKIRASIDRQELSIDNAENVKQLKDINSLLAETKLSGAQLGTASTKGRFKILEDMWSRDPLTSLQMNINEALTFNRNSFIKEYYVDAIRKMGKDPRHDPNAPEFMKGMRDYMEMQYRRATDGFKNRPSWINNSTRAITGLQVMTTQGFGVLGAARNFVSGYYFHASQGLHTLRNSKKQLRENDELIEAMNNEAKKGGYRFKEAGAGVLEEGLAPIEGLDSRKIDWRMNDSGEMELVYDGIKPTGEVASKLYSKAIQKSLIFHRIGENALRRNIWELAFADAFYQRQQDVVWRGDLTSEGTLADGKFKEASRFAGKMAAEAVDTFAFEYSVVNKAPIISGTAPKLNSKGQPKMSGTDYATAAGSVIFQYMHYPMSFAGFQAESGKGTLDGLASKQGLNTPEGRNMLGLAGVYLGVRAFSVLTNSDLRRLMPNDTIERLEQVYLSITNADSKKDEKQIYGILSQVTGPTVSRSLFWANYAGVLSTPDSAIENAIFGYQQYSRLANGTPREVAKWNNLQVELSKLKHRTVPNVQRGAGIPTIAQQEFSIYPTRYTRDWRKKINKKSYKYLGERPFTNKKVKETKPKQRRTFLLGENKSRNADEGLLSLSQSITSRRKR